MKGRAEVARCLEGLGHEVIVADPNFAPRPIVGHGGETLLSLGTAMPRPALTADKPWRYGRAGAGLVKCSDRRRSREIQP
jgi:hypothetical protein